jgi:hypothetical protein
VSLSSAACRPQLNREVLGAEFTAIGGHRAQNRLQGELDQPGCNREHHRVRPNFRAHGAALPDSLDRSTQVDCLDMCFNQTSHVSQLAIESLEPGYIGLHSFA